METSRAAPELSCHTVGERRAARKEEDTGPASEAEGRSNVSSEAHEPYLSFRDLFLMQIRAMCTRDFQFWGSCDWARIWFSTEYLKILVTCGRICRQVVGHRDSHLSRHLEMTQVVSCAHAREEIRSLRPTSFGSSLICAASILLSMARSGLGSGDNNYFFIIIIPLSILLSIARSGLAS